MRHLRLRWCNSACKVASTHSHSTGSYCLKSLRVCGAVEVKHGVLLYHMFHSSVHKKKEKKPRLVPF